MDNSGMPEPLATTQYPWKTWLAIALMVVGAVFGWTWIIALLFWGWAMNDIITGKSFFIETVSRKLHPITFWALQLLWIYFGYWYLTLPK